MSDNKSVLNLGFAPEKGGNINGSLVATSGVKELELPFAVNQTKQRLVEWINIDLGASTVTAEIFVRRQNPNGTTSDTEKIPLSTYQTSADYQANKVTFNCNVFLDDGDKLMIESTNSTGGSLNVGYTARYKLNVT